MKTESLGIVLASGNVIRCHTSPCTQRQSVGQHTWRALVLLHWLYDPYYPPANLTYALLMHDVAEIHTGDMPGHVKAQYAPLAEYLDHLEHEFNVKHGLDHPRLAELTRDEKHTLQLCDRADLTLYALDELEMGNRFMSEVVRNAYQMTSDIAARMSDDPNRERIDELMEALHNRMEDLCCE